MPHGGTRLHGQVVIAGSASGDVLHATQPLSFWGGYDAASGRITDTHHPLAGEVAAGKALVLPATRGSSTTTAVLLEAIRRETAPAALITRGVDAFLALACVVGQEMYGRSPALIAVGEDEFRSLAGWPRLKLRDGVLTPGDG
jgi:predicted aconitase with swiveling domain